MINFVFYCICDCLSFSDSFTVAIGLNNCNCVTNFFLNYNTTFISTQWYQEKSTKDNTHPLSHVGSILSFVY
jgi:hypothetical protein